MYCKSSLKHPKILILDDSTSAVDTKTDSLIRKAFREEIPNTTKIIIAQRISSVEDCDKIIVMDNGKINGIGTHEELLKITKYTRKYMNLKRKEEIQMNKKIQIRKGTVKRLLSYITKNYKKQFICVFICIIFSSIAQVAGSLFLQILIDDYITPL